MADQDRAAFEATRAEFLGQMRAEHEAREAARAEARRLFEGVTLPELQGSPRQVAWAKDIRLDILAEIVAEVRAQAEVDTDRLVAAVVKAARPHRSAAAWINLRGFLKTKIGNDAGQIYRAGA